MSQDDYYAKGQELSKDGIYQILAEEAWRDGELSGGDSELLEGFRKYLRLANDRAMRILDVAEDKYRSQTIGRLRDFSPTHCYARALRYAFGDAEELSEKEEKYLLGLASAVGLSDKEQATIRQRLEAKGWRPGPGGATKGIDESLRANLADMASVGGDLMETDRQPAIQEGDLGLGLDSLPPPRPEPEQVPEAAEPIPEPDPSAPEPPAATPAAADPAPAAAEAEGAPEEPPPAEETPEKSSRRKRRRERIGKDEDGTLGYRAEGKEIREKLAEAQEEPKPRKRKKKRRRKPTPGPDATMSGRKRKKKRRKDGESSLRKSRRKEQEAAPPAPGFLEQIPSTARIMLLVGCLTGGMLLLLPYIMPGDGPVITTDDPPGAGVSKRYQELEELHGKAAFKVKRLEVRGPEPPNGPALDLGEAWDLYAGRDGFLYGTSLYRIFKIDPRSGKAEWVAGSGLLGEPKDGQKALEAAMDPADPRVDAAGTLYFRQGNTAVYRVERDGKLTRLLGSLESRQVWEDGTPARDARPGAIEQIALGAGGRLYFDEYSGETRGPEILGRIEPGDKLRAMFLFSMETLDHPYSRLVKTYVGAGNGFENLVVGEDGALYFAVGKRLYRWRPGQGPPTLLMPEAPLEFTVDREGSVLAIRENRIERWFDLDKWTRENRFVELIAGVDDGTPTANEVLPLPGTAVAYHQPRSLTLDPDGMLYVLDGTVGGTGRARPRIDMIKRVDAPR